MARGLGARTPGEEFVSTSNADEKIYVTDISFYPSNKPEYPSPELMQAELKKVIGTVPNATVVAVSKFNTTDRAFGVAIFDTVDKRKLVFVKPFRTVNPDPTQNAWNNQTGIPGFRYNGKTATKGLAGMMPQDILTTLIDLTPDDIVQQVSDKFGAKSPLTKITQAIASGQELPITFTAPTELSFTAFRDYFCEILHPISLQAGNYIGNAGDAASQFLGKNGYSDTLISFGAEKTEGLSDSIVINPQGKKIKVSSKGAGGAQASAKNLLDLSREVKNVKGNKQVEVMNIIETVIHSGARHAPLVLGKRYHIISEKDENDILNMYKQPMVSMKAVAKMPISENLRKILEDRTTDNPNNVNLYFHAIAAVAHLVAEKVNEETDFSEVASSLLNNGALVQVYTKASENGDKWTLRSFDTIWPSNVITGVKFSASKNYYSTGVKGNFTFKIMRNGATDVEDDRETGKLPPPEEPTSSPIGKRIKIRPKGATTREPRGAFVPGLGRERR